MTTIDDGLLVYLRLDALSDDTTLLDLSGNEHNGTLEGSAQLVPDDLFGSALNLSGAGWVTLPSASIPQGATITISFWANGASGLPGGGVAALGAQTAASEQALAIYLPSSDSSIIFDCGYASGTSDRLQQSAEAASYQGSWSFWTFTKDAASGAMQIFLNGNLWASSADSTRTLPAVSQATFGALNSTLAYQGKLACLRIYNRVLSSTEIMQVMDADPAAAATFDGVYPIGFSLLNTDGHAVLDIDDDPSGYELFLTLSNNADRTIDITAPASTTPSADNYHFALHFRPGTLATAALTQVSVASAGWTLQAAQEIDGSASFYLLSSAAQSLDPGASITLTLQSISAAASGGARNTRVELTYQQLQYAADLTPLTGSRLQNMMVLNAQGARTPPLHVGFVGPNMVLNDGTSTNALTLRITNLLDDAALALSPSSGAAPTTLILAFDAQDSNEQKDWALGTTSQVNAIDVQMAGWASAKDPESAEWTLTTTQTALAADGYFQLELGNIVSSLPAGNANLYLIYENWPGYRDGYFVVPIEKTPLVYTDSQRVGIGTNQPSRPLGVRGAGSSEELVSFEDRAGTTTWHINQKLHGTQSAFNISESDVADGRLYLQAGGNAGIGTTTPRTGLDTGAGVLSGAANDYIKAQWTMSGGGSVSWGGSGNRLKWTARFIAISAERPHTFASGFVNIVQPTSDIPAANVYNGVARSANADGVVLNAWEALYAVHTVGGNESAVTLQIASYANASFYVPSNWLLVAVVNGDDGTVKLGTGVCLNPNTTSLNGSPIPSGTIMLWSGASNNIPGGWVLCNGANGTPDLRDRFIVGAGNSYGVGSIGGTPSVQLSISQLPSHSHATTVSEDDGHTHNVYFDTGSGGDGPNGDMAKVDHGLQKGVSADFGVKTGKNGDHTHTVSVQNTGGNEAHENRPPYYALCYIMKQ